MKIAIKGDKSRGKEVIQILESLGGKNLKKWNGDGDIRDGFFINDDGIIEFNNLPKGYKLYTLEEFEKEFPFKVGDKVTDHEGDVAIITGFAHIEEKLGYSLQYENGRGTATPRILKPYKKMKEERNITLTLDKAKEWYKKGGELKEIALQAFTEKELNPLPKSWEDFCDKYSKINDKEYFIEANSNIVPVHAVVPNHCRLMNSDRNICPSKQSAEAHLAMIQLEQLRDCWRQENTPKEGSLKYKIRKVGDEYIILLGTEDAFLSFRDKQTAEEFLECFRDLIEKAGDLI